MDEYHAIVGQYTCTFGYVINIIISFIFRYSQENGVYDSLFYPLNENYIPFRFISIRILIYSFNRKINQFTSKSLP